MNPVPVKVLGQLPQPQSLSDVVSPPSLTGNLLEGRELYSPQAVAVDNSRTPSAIYVCDTNNNRVLGWKDSQSFNNGQTADVVLGQKDLFSSRSMTSLTQTSFSGFNGPTGIAIDKQGNVFVADTRNNRIVRFPSPLDPSRTEQKVDLIIGQVKVVGMFPNQSSSFSSNDGPNATSIRTASNSVGAQKASLVFDADGNLWFSDSGNNRIVRYPAAQVSGGANVQSDGTLNPVVTADSVLGQSDFATALQNPGRTFADLTNKALLRFGGPLAMDADGNLYYSDDLARVMVYLKPGPGTNGKAADRILGLIKLSSGQTAPPATNDIAFGAALQSASTVPVGGPQGLFCIGTTLFVVDTYNNRLMRFAPYTQWPAESQLISPKAAGVLGQDNFNSREQNRYHTYEPTSKSFYYPAGAAVDSATHEVWIADSNNNRVLVFPDLTAAGDTASARGVLGQVSYEFRTPNFIQGREFSSGTATVSMGTQTVRINLGPYAVVDSSSTPPRLYIADTGNNRVLGFADANRVKPGDYADIVLGQVDFYRSLINSPYNDSASPTDTGLQLPAQLAIDSDGNLWVADAGNGRVLRFPRPFDHRDSLQRADVVLGAPNFTTKPSATATAGNMLFPTSLAFTTQGQLLVGDAGFNRVLRFDTPLDNSQSGKAASLVLGQPDFATSTSGNDPAKLATPLQIAIDRDDRLYVADSGNKRVVVYDVVNGPFMANGTAAYVLPLKTNNFLPLGIAVDRSNNNIWVADAGSMNYVRRFPSLGEIFAMLLTSPGNALSDASSSNFLAYAPAALALDGFGNPVLFDGASRLSFVYPGLVGGLQGSGFPIVVPGGLATVMSSGVTFAGGDAVAGGAPLPRELNDIEVFVDGTSAPMTHVASDRAEFQVPSATTAPGYSYVLVRRVSTGQTIASQWVRVYPQFASFLLNGAIGSGPIKAKNEDGSDNSASNPAKSGSQVTLYLTGAGKVSGQPEDGTGSDAAVSLDGGGFYMPVPSDGSKPSVVSSTLDPSQPGVWKLVVKLPNGVFSLPAYNYGVSVAVVYKTLPSNTNPLTQQKIVTTIAIKQ